MTLLNRQSWKILICLFLFIFITMFNISIDVFADEKSNDIPFDISTETSDKQVDTNKTYFDLRLAPNEQTVININITNKLDSELKLIVDVEPAKTNTQGVIEYGKFDGALSSSAPFDLEKQILYAKEIDLSPKETKKLPITVKASDKSYSGIMVGGINIHQKEVQSNDDESGMSIRNRLGYQIALVLHGNDSFNYDMKFLDVEASQINYRNAFLIKLENLSNNFLNTADISAKVKKKGTNSYLYTNRNTSEKVAPYSIFSFPIFLNEKEFEPGIYVVDTVIKYDSYEWKFSKEIKINKNVAEKYNAEDVTIRKEKKSITLYYVFIIIIVILLIILLSTFYKLKRSKIIK